MYCTEMAIRLTFNMLDMGFYILRFYIINLHCGHVSSFNTRCLLLQHTSDVYLHARDMLPSMLEWFVELRALSTQHVRQGAQSELINKCQTARTCPSKSAHIL